MHDDFDSVLADRFTVLEHVPVPDTWSRVPDHMPPPGTSSAVRFTEEVVTMIDLEAPIPTETSRKGPMRVLVAGVLAAAAVIGIVVVVSNDVDDVTPSDEPSPTLTVPPTVPPRPMRDTPGAQFVPGTYYVDEVAGTPTPRMTATLGVGWVHAYGSPGEVWAISKLDIGWITFDRAVAVFSDACHPSAGYHPGPVTTLDGLVAALSEQQGWAEVTTPTDISIDGYLGKTFQRTAPADMSNCDRRDSRGRVEADDGLPGYPDFRSWESPAEVGARGGDYYETGEIEILRVLDLDGTLVVITAHLWVPTAETHAAFAAVLDSIRISQP